MTVSTNPAIKGEIIYIMLNPKIIKCHLTQARAERKPTATPRPMATNAQRFSTKKFLSEASKKFTSRIKLI
jgi:predicted metalloprotease